MDDFDAVAKSAPEELRKGPRGGGRNTSKVVEHVVRADEAYAREMGIKLNAPIEEIRSAMLEVLGEPSDGSPIADRKWTPRYAAHRIAWHALDHAWEIEDRSKPAE
jgi:glutamine synthetase